MAIEWPVLSLREAGVALIDCEHRTPAAVADGYPYVAIPQMRNGRIEPTTARRVSPEDYVTWTRKALPRDHDVVLSRRTNPGETAIASLGLQYVLGQNLVLLRADGLRVYPPFLRWLVRGPEWWEQIGRFRNVGAVFDSLRCADIPSFRVRIPPLADQVRISGFLGALDDKIELNQPMSEALEAAVRALFRSWFVDFDPVRAKSNGGDTGLPSHLASLFPDAFEDSEVGEVPAGWRVQPLDQIATFTNGLALQRFPPIAGRSLPVIKISELRAGSTVGADRASAQLPPAYVVHDGDVLFSWSGTLEVELWRGGTGALNQHLFKVASDTYPKWFCYLWTRHHLPAFRAIAAGKATTMGHIQRGHLTAARVVVPDQPFLDATSKYFDPIIDRIVTAGVQARMLADTRDTLLPKLISGELRVPDAEAFDA